MPAQTGARWAFSSKAVGGTSTLMRLAPALGNPPPIPALGQNRTPSPPHQGMKREPRQSEHPQNYDGRMIKNNYGILEIIVPPTQHSTPER
eukprot:gene10841-7508_t